ncbi:MAG: N-acyl-D-amino-acid deacylase [Cytophagales bacterium]|nr:D-aminoacylase [Bacteroidota bacterium]WHZ08113.1 MAG: N-acyl-D-amino-acid deacylase [Cytophagales bacterium]
MNRPIGWIVLGICVLTGCQPKKYDLIIRNAKLHDGEKSYSEYYDVAVRADTIAALAVSGKLNGISENEIDAKGLLLSPGFIDTHSHHDWGLADDPGGLAVVSQGVTTIIVGQDGGSRWPLTKYFQSLADSPVAVNIGSYSGHNTLRDEVLKDDFKRTATPPEINRMTAMLKQDMEAGAFGLSTGLEYDPGIYSSHDEVLQLTKVLPPFHGKYISHLRSEDRYFWDALQEIITIGKETKIPVQISHFKLAMRGLWGKADSSLRLLEEARKNGVEITADIYPYAYWSSTIRVLFPNRNFSDEKEAAYILREITTPEGIIFSHYDPNPEYNGKSLAEVAKQEKKPAEKMLIELIRRLDECDKKKGDCSGSIVATSMEENDIGKLMQWQHSNICSDGASTGRHPRGFGAFTRVLAYYVREKKILTLDEAIYKMTALAADHMDINKRGRIKAGHYADLVLFNPATVKDEATLAEPQKISSGIERVWVNGREVFSNHQITGLRPGQVIHRAQ